MTPPAATVHREPDVAEQLRTIATTAASFANALDLLRTRHPAAGLDRSDPVAAALDQAAAAAHDLSSSAEIAASTITQPHTRGPIA